MGRTVAIPSATQSTQRGLLAALAALGAGFLGSTGHVPSVAPRHSYPAKSGCSGCPSRTGAGRSWIIGRSSNPECPFSAPGLPAGGFLGQPWWGRASRGSFDDSGALTASPPSGGGRCSPDDAIRGLRSTARSRDRTASCVRRRGREMSVPPWRSFRCDVCWGDVDTCGHVDTPGVSLALSASP